MEYVADARKIPLPNFSVSEIYAAHVIEHFWWHEIEALLKEWYRILEVGGKVEIYTPDSEFIMARYFDGGWKKEVEACPKEMGYGLVHGSDTDRNMWLNFKLHGTGFPTNAHVTSFSFEMMKTCMEKAGFWGVVRIGEPGYTLGVEARK